MRRSARQSSTADASLGAVREQKRASCGRADRFLGGEARMDQWRIDFSATWCTLGRAVRGPLDEVEVKPHMDR